MVDSLPSLVSRIRRVLQNNVYLYKQKSSDQQQALDTPH